MKINSTKQLRLPRPKLATVVFLIRSIMGSDHILLGKKQTDPGRGKLMEPGGKLKRGEIVVVGAERETKEECGASWKTRDAKYLGHVTFFRFMLGANIPFFKVHLFSVRKWRGKIRDGDNIGNWQWFPVRRLPFEQMMAGDVHWIPQSLGRDMPIRGKVFYNVDNTEVRGEDIRDWSGAKLPR